MRKKVGTLRDERWYATTGDFCPVSDETLARWKAAYGEMQKEIHALIRGQGGHAGIKKVVITTDERWPDYDFKVVKVAGSGRFDVSEETLERWRNARAAYEAMQDEIRALIYPNG